MAYKSKNYNLELLTRNDFVDAEKHISENFKKLDEVIGNIDAKDLKEHKVTFPETTTPEFPTVTSGGTLAKILGDIKRNINSLVARVMGVSNPNLLINGDFQIWQRGTSFVDISSNLYTIDRWGCHDNILKKVERVMNTSKAPCTYAAKLSFKALYNQFCQPIEGYAALSGKTVTLSFWMKGTGSIGSNAIGATVGRTAIVFTVTAEWKLYQFTCVFTPGDITRMRGVSIYNSVFDGDFNIELAGIKLEFGSYATPFVPRSYGEELALCQRYYQIHTTGDIAYEDLRPSMRISPQIRVIEDGKYSYEAEIY